MIGILQRWRRGLFTQKISTFTWLNTVLSVTVLYCWCSNWIVHILTLRMMHLWYVIMMTTYSWVQLHVMKFNRLMPRGSSMGANKLPSWKKVTIYWHPVMGMMAREFTGTLHSLEKLKYSNRAVHHSNETVTLFMR